MLYPAELVRTIERGEQFGIDVNIREINFEKVMVRMRSIIQEDIDSIRKGLLSTSQIKYYNSQAEFVAPYVLKVGGDLITSKMILLCIGSRPTIPGIRGLDKVEYLTSDSVIKMNMLPRSINIIGGGYIAAEYGHFFSSMGSRVTIIGRNPQFLPEEEPEISSLAKRELNKHMNIVTNHEVTYVEEASDGSKKIIAVNKSDGGEVEFISDQILIATGRNSNADVINAQNGGILTDNDGWIIVDDYMETSQPNIWAFGDAIGKYQFKHVANYESKIVYYNAVLKKKSKVDYRAVPHAVFTYPEIAAVGLREKEAVEKFGDNVLIGIHRYQDTAKGEAMALNDYFVKVIVDRVSMKILGAHLIGPYASILIQEIINLMYTQEETIWPIMKGMHIHPSLSEVVDKAFRSLMTPDQYHHLIEHHYGIQPV
jgi:dihydrolipoamide dehydrogenase